MKARFDAGTDVAMIGAWDAARGAQPFSADEVKRLSESLDAEADAGHVFVLRTGGDGAGPVDVYIDEPIPAETIAAMTVLGDDLILALPSGSLMVDGVEYFRGQKPDAARSSRAVAVPPGDYVLRCYVAKDEEQQAERQRRDVEAAVGSEDLRYYERVTRTGCLTGLLMLALFPLLLPFVGSRIAAVVTVIAFIGYFTVRERLLRRNPRFMRLRDRVTAHRLAREEPTLALELRRKV